MFVFREFKNAQSLESGFKNQFLRFAPKRRFFNTLGLKNMWGTLFPVGLAYIFAYLQAWAERVERVQIIYLSIAFHFIGSQGVENGHFFGATFQKIEGNHMIRAIKNRNMFLFKNQDTTFETLRILKFSKKPNSKFIFNYFL